MSRDFDVKLVDMNHLQERLSDTDFLRLEGVVKKNTNDMRNRAVSSDDPSKGGTPVDTRELQISMKPTFDGVESEIGTNKDYGPHVEYGHRTRNGGYVEGQKFLQNNVRLQRPIYYDDLQKQLKKGK